jgi:hypothetical protein
LLSEGELEQMRLQLREKLRKLIEVGTVGPNHYPAAGTLGESPRDYTLHLSKPVIAKGHGNPKLLTAGHRALKTRRQAILRLLPRSDLTRARRSELKAELGLLANLETGFFGVHHRGSSLPIDANDKPYVPSVRDIVELAVFQKFALDKDNLPMALAKLAAINPEKYRERVWVEARSNPLIRRALTRVWSDASRRWSPTGDELLVLSNFYVATHFPSPLFGMSYEQAVLMLNEKTKSVMSSDRYRRILRKFLLPW